MNWDGINFHIVPNKFSKKDYEKMKMEIFVERAVIEMKIGRELENEKNFKF
jgi:hypothetical protein